ncbi:MAG: hypothetical protein J3K34DRAFT_72256 [Monoraphidium minutum]|nr:MAG: hypothetical protein J3K34DRAFT_72256 [Monoraphidium minutum]
MVFLAQLTLRPARIALQAAEAAAGRRARRGARINVCAATCAQPAGELQLHSMDASHLRRTLSGAWRFDSLLDLGTLTAALRRTVSRYPPVAGWLEPRAGGGVALKWDAAAPNRGAAWFRASAPGLPPAVDDDEALYERDCLPTLERHCLLAIQATHFPDAGATLLVATIDHVCCDFQAFMDFLSAWCHECAAEAGGAELKASCVVPAPPPPVWDRALLAPVPAAPRAAAALLSGGGADTDSSCGSAAGGGDDARSVASDDRWWSADDSSDVTDDDASDAARLGGIDHKLGTPAIAAPSRALVNVWAGAGGGASDDASSSCSSGSGASPPGRRGKDAAFWPRPAAWHVDVLSRRQNASMLWRGVVSAINAETRTWVLPRAAIDGLKAALSGAMPAGGRGATANDVIAALVAAGAAWAGPRKVACRGGLNAHVVVNARGRFGHSAGADYFGSNSLLVPVWCPASLLPAPGVDASPLPSPALVAHIHSALRSALADPGGLMRARFEWMDAAQAAGVAGRVRACEAAALLDGDVCIDNVSNYPVFSLKFGGAASAAAASVRFIAFTRLGWVSPAGPGPDRAAGGSSGDLRLALPLKRRQWAALAPHWAALGLRHVKTGSTFDDVVYQPASVRNLLAEVTRTTLGGL